jgi:ferritin-like protein
MSGNVTSDPVAEPALRVDTREELVYLLGQACEIEHGLMCEYLYAQFSLKRGPDEGLTDGQLARVQAWEAALITVIKQEMLHLALATNILTAIARRRISSGPTSRSCPAGTRRGCRSRWCRSASGRCATSSTWNAPRGWRWTTRPGSRPPGTPSR